MFLNKGIVKKYSQALYEVAVKEKEANQILARLYNLRNLLKSIPELNQLLLTRRVQVKDKMIILNNILGDKISVIEMDLLILLVKNGHMILFAEVVKRFNYLLEKNSEVIKVEITTSIRLSNDEIQQISSKIENIIQKKIDILAETDSSIMGGIKLRVDNTLIDGSVHGRLQQIRDMLTQV